MFSKQSEFLFNVIELDITEREGVDILIPPNYSQKARQDFSNKIVIFIK
jgi:hypothetical protein